MLCQWVTLVVWQALCEDPCSSSWLELKSREYAEVMSWWDDSVSFEPTHWEARLCKKMTSSKYCLANLNVDFEAAAESNAAAEVSAWFPT